MALLYFPFDKFSPRFGENFYTSIIRNPDFIDGVCLYHHVVYNIEIKRGKQTWHVMKRFSGFETLLYDIKREIDPKLCQDLPQLPPKSWLILIIYDEEFIRKRKKLLNKFLEDLLCFLSSKKIFPSCVKNFLEFNE